MKPEPEIELQHDKILKLYLSILDKLVREEYNHNGFSNLPTLLADSQFLRSVAAVGLEVDLRTNSDRDLHHR